MDGMDRFPEELDLERRFRNNQITTPEEFLTQLRQVYDLVNGDIGRITFNEVILPGLLKKHGSDISAAGLEALALLAEASFMPHTKVDGFLNSWTAKKIAGRSAIGPLESVVLGSPEEGVNFADPDYRLPILIYSNDSRFKRPSANWGNPVYKSGTVNRSHQLIVTREISEKKPSIETVIEAESAQIIGRVQPAGYVGEIDGNKFNTQNGDDPLIIAYGLLSEVGYRHVSDKEYGFLYMVTSQGTRPFVGGSLVRRSKVRVPAVTAVFAVLPRQDYEEMVGNQFRDVKQFTLNMLPDRWKSYLAEGGFFSKPKVIGMIDAKSPYLNYNTPLR